MKKVIILLYKDFLLLIRDRAGLALSFLMPMILVLIMTTIQDSTFKSINETRIPLILLNNDQDSLGNTIENELLKSKIFQISTKINKKNVDPSVLKKSVASGKFQIGIIIPAHTTSGIRKSIRKNISLAFSGIKIKTKVRTDTSQIIIYIDPATKTSFKNSILSGIREYTSKIESNLILKEISTEVNKRIPGQNINLKNVETVSYKEEYALNNNSRIIPNSVQHNVPAWTLFGMFFIVVSLAGNIIKEREEGSFFRLQIMPCSYFSYLASKIIIYSMVCLLQFVLMLSVGLFVFPAIGLPSLAFGGNYAALFVVALSSGLAAIGFGLAIGSFSTSHLQATTFGSISVVILAAIGGIWVPVFAMPSFMRNISTLSPMNWGLNGFYDIFIRDGNFMSVIPESLSLIIFALICLLISLAHNYFKSR